MALPESHLVTPFWLIVRVQGALGDNEVLRAGTWSIKRERELPATFGLSVADDVDEPAKPSTSSDRMVMLLATGIVLLTLFWLLLTIVTRPIPFAVLSPEASIGIESVAAFARLSGALVARTIAGALFVIGLVPARPPALARRVAAVIAAVSLSLGVLAVSLAPALPRLVQPISLSAAAVQTSGPLPSLTLWH